LPMLASRLLLWWDLGSFGGEEKSFLGPRQFLLMAEPLLFSPPEAVA
jgi:hypothetical protein